MGVRAGMPVVSQVLGGPWNSCPKDGCQLPRDTRLVRGRAGRGPGRLPASVRPLCRAPPEPGSPRASQVWEVRESGGTGSQPGSQLPPATLGVTSIMGFLSRSLSPLV